MLDVIDTFLSTIKIWQVAIIASCAIMWAMGGRMYTTIDGRQGIVEDYRWSWICSAAGIFAVVNGVLLYLDGYDAVSGIAVVVGIATIATAKYVAVPVAMFTAGLLFLVYCRIALHSAKAKKKALEQIVLKK